MVFFADPDHDSDILALRPFRLHFTDVPARRRHDHACRARGLVARLPYPAILRGALALARRSCRSRLRPRAAKRYMASAARCHLIIIDAQSARAPSDETPPGCEWPACAVRQGAAVRARQGLGRASAGAQPHARAQSCRPGGVTRLVLHARLELSHALVAAEGARRGW